MADPLMKDRVTALAAVFQAAALVDEFAQSGTAAPDPFSAAVRSLFALDAADTREIYPDPRGLALGRGQLAATLRRENRDGTAQRLSYVMAILHLNGLMRADPGMQAVIRNRLAEIAASVPDEQRTTDDAIAKIAALYVETFGNLRFRVQVKGDPGQLKKPEVAARIRASLFAGVRAAHLWHHQGGRRWHLLFGGQRMLATLE